MIEVKDHHNNISVALVQNYINSRSSMIDDCYQIDDKCVWCEHGFGRRGGSLRGVLGRVLNGSCYFFVVTDDCLFGRRNLKQILLLIAKWLV